MNREEILYLLRLHVDTLSRMLQKQNYVSKHVLWGGGGPENVGGLQRINELFEALKDIPNRKPETSGE